MNSSRLLSLSTINQALLNVRYAVRGEIPIRAAEIKAELATDSSSYNFSQISELNIGNPQFFEFQKVESTRLVMSRLLHHFTPHANLTSTTSFLSPELESEIDEIALEYLSQVSFRSTQENVQSMVPSRSVSKFIQSRDGLDSNPNHIFSGNGASQAITTILNLLIDGPNSGIMCSVPTYPLYSALISLFNGSFVKYHLDEDDGWNVNIQELEKSYQEAKKNGIQVKAIVLINPGNPTGNVFDLERMKEIVDFCYQRNIVVLADEVYQENILNSEKKFHSFKSVMNQADSNIKNNLELISFHTISKGFLGECGLRGGYMELDNIDPAMVDVIRVLSNRTRPNIIGDLCLDLKSRFLSGDLADMKNLQKLFDQQNNEKIIEFTERAKMVETALNSCNGVKTNPIDGAMYAFPTLMLPPKFIKEANDLGVVPDFLYCKKLLENTGLCTVPGSGFGQVEGTYHLRTTILPSPNERLNNIMKRFQEFNDQLQSDYS
jgi:alanine transaminase